MDRLTLSMAALAAKSDFGPVELVGHYHNEGLYYVLGQLDGSKKNDIELVKKLIIQFCSALPAGIFGKASKQEQKNIAQRVLEKMGDPSPLKNSPDWTAHPDFSGPANKTASDLLRRVASFADPEITASDAKAQLERWQRTLEGKSFTPRDRTVLGAAGSVARYSLAYWILEEPSPLPRRAENRKLCKKQERLPFAAADILGALVGGLIGFGFGGPTGALVGGMAGGQLASAA